MFSILLEIKNKNRKFVIHEHHAEKAGLHYDIRLEKNNVLVSWYSRNLPELINNTLSRIYIGQTPDHNYNDWIDKSGYIDTDYGRGNTYIYDSGTYEELEWTNDKIKINFFGKKIKGIYVIIRYNDGFLMIKQKKKS